MRAFLASEKLGLGKMVRAGALSCLLYGRLGTIGSVVLPFVVVDVVGCFSHPI